MQPSDITAVEEEWLVDLCHKAQREGGMIGGQKHGDKVVKISDEIVVRYGGVQPSEAMTQEFAFNNVDRNIVYVPKVYRYIQSQQGANLRGYLFMEYVQGRNLKGIDLKLHHDIPSRVAKILAHLGQITGSSLAPGPIGHGEPLGYIFGDDGAKTSFKSIEDMNMYMNKRLKFRNDSVDFTSYPLVLCHGDVSRRNMILKKDGSLCLVDWGYSGLYPRFWELATTSCVLPYDEAFEKPLTSELEKFLGLSEQEKQDMHLTLCVRGANLRWSFDESQPDPEEEKRKFFQWKSERDRKEREAAEVPELSKSNLHSGKIGSGDRESHPETPYDLLNQVEAK